MIAPALDAVLAGVVLLGLALPPGFLALRFLGIQASPLARLVLALGLGLVIVLSVFVLEVRVLGPWLILPMTLGCLLLLKPDRSIIAPLRGLVPEILASLVLGSLAVLANGGDVVQNGEGLSVRIGFDVADRAFYGMVAQELERAPFWALENPAFAPAPLQYSYLPALAGLLVQRYAGVDALFSFGTSLPAFGLFFTGLAVAALAQAFGAGVRTRLVCMALVSFGGDLSFLVPEIGPAWFDRTRYFFVFYSFGAESAFYNPWMLGMPLAFATLLGLKILMDGPGRKMVGPVALLLAALFQTKVFAFVPIWLAVALYAFGARDRRLGIVAGGALLLALPGALLAAASEGVRGGAPLAFEPLAMIRDAVANHPSLTRLSALAGFPAAAAVIILGGAGLRLLGLPELARRMHGSEKGPARLIALIMLIGLILSLTTVGRPTRLEGIQFIFLPYALMWVFTGLALLGQPRFPGLASFLVLALSVIMPVRYIAMKVAPGRFSSSPIDQARFVLSAPTVEACRWLRVHSRADDRLVLPLSGDSEDRGGLKPLYAGLLASRRLVGQAAMFHVGEKLVRERRATIDRLYETTDQAEGERLLSQLRVAWVWEDVQRRLQFQSPRLTPRALIGRTRLVQFDARD